MRAPGPELGAMGQPPAQLRVPHGAAPTLGRQTPRGSPQPHTRTPRGAAPQDQVRTARGGSRVPTYAQPGGQPPIPIRTLPGAAPPDPAPHTPRGVPWPLPPTPRQGGPVGPPAVGQGSGSRHGALSPPVPLHTAPVSPRLCLTAPSPHAAPGPLPVPPGAQPHSTSSPPLPPSSVPSNKPAFGPPRRGSVWWGSPRSRPHGADPWEPRVPPPGEPPKGLFVVALGLGTMHWGGCTMGWLGSVGGTMCTCPPGGPAWPRTSSSPPPQPSASSLRTAPLLTSLLFLCK